MRNFQFLLLAVTAFLLGSCNFLNNTESNYTPQIICNTILLNHIDTLSYAYSSSSSGYVLDTIAVGDTVTFSLGFYTYANNLKQISVTGDAKYASITLQLDSIVETILTSESNVSEGLLYFPVGYNYVAFKMDYLATAVNKNTELKLYVASDSKYSPTKVTFVTPIVAAK